MTKNQKTYALLFTVVVVWGAIGFQLYKHYNPAPVETHIGEVPKFIPQQGEKQVGYAIQPDYRDPFLGKIYKKKVAVKKTKKPKPKVNFPPIVFNGEIKGNQKLYIISINGKQEIFKLRQSIQGIQLIKASARSVVLKYQGVRKEFKL